MTAAIIDNCDKWSPEYFVGQCGDSFIKGLDFCRSHIFASFLLSGPHKMTRIKADHGDRGDGDYRDEDGDYEDVGGDQEVGGRPGC